MKLLPLEWMLILETGLIVVLAAWIFVLLWYRGSPFDSFFRNHRNIVLHIDKEGRIRNANPMLNDLAGFQRNEIIGFHYSDLLKAVHEEDSLSLMLQRKETGTLELVLKHKTGASIHMAGTMIPGSPRERMESVYLIGMDITETKRIHKALEQSEANYRFITENITEMIAVLDLEGRYMYLSSSCSILWEVNKHSPWLGEPFECLLMDKQEQLDARSRFEHLVRTGEAFTMQAHVQVPGGPPLCMEAKVTLVRNGEGEPHKVIVVSRDVTERKRMEQQLIENEAHYRRLVELSPEPILLHQDGTIIYANPAGIRLMNSGREGLMGADLSDYFMESGGLLRQKPADNPYRADEPIRMRRADGEILKVLVSGFYDNSSGTHHLLISDITELARATRSLAESEQRFRALVEANPDMIVLTRNRRIVYANPAAFALLGAVDERDLSGMPTNLLLGSHSIAIIEREMLDGQEKSGLMELTINRLNGELLHVEAMTIRMSYGPEGATFLTLARDITRRKQAEEKQLEAEERLRQSQAVYLQLQESLDRFSSDVYGIMHKKDLERRILKEVRDVLKLEKVWMLEKEPLGSHYEELYQQPLGELVPWGRYSAVKVSESGSKITLMVLEEDSPQLQLESVRIWLQTLSRYAHVLYDNFRVIEDLTQELEEQVENRRTTPWLMRAIFNLSETERKHLSQDLHDTALQEQILWYRKLEGVIHHHSVTEELRRELVQISEGLLDVIYQIRLTCNELRPPMLVEQGIHEALKDLFQQVQLRADFSIRFEDSCQQLELGDELSIGIYRIMQEMLANAAKHSDATEIELLLFEADQSVYLRYTDNGIGMNLKQVGKKSASMGLHGMIERVKSLEGVIDFDSSPHKGLEISIVFPLTIDSMDYKAGE